MANESFALSFTAPPRLERTTLASIAFFALLILVFVGFQPFIPPSPGTPLAAADAGQGDLIHQILYLGVFAVILLTAVQRRGLGAARALPFVLGLLQLWCLLSAIWAAEHGIAFRRATLEVVLTLSVLLSADTIGSGPAASKAARAFRCS